jgi:hypothetical protein
MPSASSSLNFGVERLQFHAGIFNAELPATPIFSLEVALVVGFVNSLQVVTTYAYVENMV